MNNSNKPFIIVAAAIAALFAISFVVRFVALSEMGLPGGWMLFLFLPAGGIGLLVVLLRLGLLNSLGQNFSAFASAPSAPLADEVAATAGDREPARQRSPVRR